VVNFLSAFCRLFVGGQIRDGIGFKILEWWSKWWLIQLNHLAARLAAQFANSMKFQLIATKTAIGVFWFKGSQAFVREPFIYLPGIHPRPRLLGSV